MKQIYTCPQGHCVLDEDHPATGVHPHSGVEEVAVQYVRQRPDGTWYMWNAGALARSVIQPTDLTMPG